MDVPDDNIEPIAIRRYCLDKALGLAGILGSAKAGENADNVLAWAKQFESFINGTKSPEAT